MELGTLIATSETVEVYKSGNTAIKLFKEGAPKTAALYEALTHARVEATGLPIPVIHEISVIDGRWAIHMDLIEGETLAEQMKRDPEHIDQYLENMLDIQLEIHSKLVPKLSKLKDKLTRQINELEGLDEVKKYELLTRLNSMPKHVKLCHGNFSPENIMMGKDGKVYIVDWVAARQGNASADIARTYLLLALGSQEQADKYLDMFCQKTGTSKKYVLDWVPIVAAARMDEDVPEERELLAKWTDVVLYE